MLVCNNDGKGKHQSCTVWDNRYEIEAISPGYGATPEEALNDYQRKAESYLKIVTNMVSYIIYADELIAADCFGKPLQGNKTYKI